MTILDKACWERGCPCYGPREGEGVKVVRREWVGLTYEDFAGMVFVTLDNNGSTFDSHIFAKYVESVLKEKNT